MTQIHKEVEVILAPLGTCSLSNLKFLVTFQNTSHLTPFISRTIVAVGIRKFTRLETFFGVKNHHDCHKKLC